MLIINGLLIFYNLLMLRKDGYWFNFIKTILSL